MYTGEKDAHHAELEKQKKELRLHVAEKDWFAEKKKEVEASTPAAKCLSEIEGFLRRNVERMEDHAAEARRAETESRFGKREPPKVVVSTQRRPREAQFLEAVVKHSF